MSNEPQIVTTRPKLVAAFNDWIQRARDENWSEAPDAERQADFLIELLGAQDELEAAR